VVSAHIVVVCAMLFILKRDKVNHQCIHSGEHTFCCGVRNKTFTLKNNLTKHKHLQSGESLYYFDVCDKTFILKGDMVNH
jgi:KRAB domain-containing zinc finger protein